MEVIEHLVGHNFGEQNLLAACLALSSRLLPLYREHFGSEYITKLKLIADIASVGCIQTDAPNKELKTLLN